VLLLQKLGNQGVVMRLKDGIATVRGVSAAKAGELLYIIGQNNTVISSLALNLNYQDIDLIVLGNDMLIKEGDLVFRSNQLLSIKASLSLFGSVCDALGNFRDNGIFSKYSEKIDNIEKKATGIIDRIPVNIPLITGLKSIDSLVPIGRGQRELIIGDRQTGKTSVGIDTILNYIESNDNIIDSDELGLPHLRKIVWFIYAAIGQKQSTVAEINRILIQKNAMWYTSIISATAAEPAPLQFLVPYTACTLGEFIRDVVGGHCTIIYDDLTKHAVAYRQMSLLLRRPPGREAFPGDVFYIHSRLLERAGSLRSLSFNYLVKGLFSSIEIHERGTLTALPVIETQAGDVSAYIPTNVISITDGQIFLETELFYKGIRPAINVGLSVSRVGSAAQPFIMKKVSGSLKMELAQFREIESFAKLGSNLDVQTQRILTRGENLIEILKQGLHQPLSVGIQFFSIFFGLGYSVSWLSDILKTINFTPMSFFTKSRIKTSWFETFRLNSTFF